MSRGRQQSRIMKRQNVEYICNVKYRHKKLTGSNDWDDDYKIINDLVKEYGTGMEDLIMSIYRKTVRNWNKVEGQP
jgi:hypothetical protein